MKTAADTLAYTVGLKSEVKGTGVWNGLALEQNAKDKTIGASISAVVLAAVLFVTAQTQGII